MTRDEKQQLRELVAQIEAYDETMGELSEILPTLKQLTEAWKAAAWFGKLIKWLGGIALGLTAILALFKLGTLDR